MFIIPLILFYFIQITLSDVFVYNDSNALIQDYDDRSAEFGPSFPTDGLKGYLTTTNPLTACGKIAPPPDIPTHGYRWIALIPRTPSDSADSCPFQTKVLNAYKANFSGVIIYNYEDELLTMGPYGKGIPIPSTLVKHTDGIALLSHYLFNRTRNSTPIYHIKIVPEKPFSYAAYLIPFASVIGLSLLGLVGFVLVKCYLQRRRTQRHRLPRSALKQLQVKKFAKGDRWEVCAICLDDYVDGAKLRILPCDHAYHMKCIDPWLLNSRRQCPVCKRYVFPNLDNPDDDNSGHQQPAAVTEQTPLMRSDEDNSSVAITRNRPLTGRRFFDHSESDEDVPSSSRQATTSQITTTEVVFERPSANSRRYGSVQNSSTVPRAANVFVHSQGDATDNINVHVHSVVEDVSDIDLTDDDNDERMHSVITESGENPAYVNDEESKTDTIQTHL